MSKRESYSCNKCRKTISQGLKLKEFGDLIQGAATVDGSLHFCGLGCLREWSMKAVIVGDGLEDTAMSLMPHGELSSPKLKGVVVR